MTIKKQKIISAGLISLGVFGGFECLAYLINLNQPVQFLKVAFLVYFYLLAKMVFLYDLHFKNPGALARAKARHESVPHWLHRFLKILFSSFWGRIEHMRRWTYFKHFQNYLVLPAIVFWSTAALLYLNLGRTLFQQTFVVISSLVLVVVYWNLKEIFSKKNEIVDHNIFVALSAVKLYAAFITFSAALGLTGYFCLPPRFFALAIFSLSALLIYQALFQHKLFGAKTLFFGVAVSLMLGAVAYWVRGIWGQNYFTAGGFLAVVYNFFWSVFHQYLHKGLNLKAFIELLFLSVIASGMLISVTNFHARLIGAC
ncbi:MAG: hypothetical protein COT92_00190 [Candidatus Doudnabacteria bacterium CG10_big_fil_rev_8_21_14_0_10_42_18]|uniref:Uncharacterized protein n=1 Tax=Candidatus Doudnabacteria bacterium CG10_big_fil_rev_8_21_14_0_10_42_18 TaxID=1974552 RepID=A0A2H0VBV5_9BACT|nr:MAG: hypothetical protein COT92_00190 [Candidatus Doudnabacteria bacterium CG10_big_fil_rev_8_21_14_0_10_42_18]